MSDEKYDLEYWNKIQSLRNLNLTVDSIIKNPSDTTPYPSDTTELLTMIEGGAFPANPWIEEDTDGIIVTEETTNIAVMDTDVDGWKYNTSTGEFWANSSGATGGTAENTL